MASGTQDVERSPDTAGSARTVEQVRSPEMQNVADEVAEDMTLAMFDGLLGGPVHQVPSYVAGGADAQGQSLDLRELTEQLEAELEGCRNDLDFANMKEEELEHRHEATKKKLLNLQKQFEIVSSELQDCRNKRQEDALELAKLRDDKIELEELVARGRREADEACKAECRNLREKVSSLECELSSMQTDASLRLAAMTSESQADGEKSLERSEDAPLLSAAYQQISVLNTQLAHLYTELTISRSESQQLKARLAEPGAAAGGSGEALGSGENDVREQQIADLVRDIRHLQLDLEYHQQKLNQMIDERQQMTKDLKKSQADLTRAKQQLEERDQMLKHREVDIAHLRQQQQPDTPGRGPPGSQHSVEGALSALRAEASAKDSALIVSHYELHKEKLIREKLEAKNLKLMERMQKLMMIVETMRKDNVSLERNLAARERSYEDKELQLRQVVSKAKQLQRIVRSSQGVKSRQRLNASATLELDSGYSQQQPAQQQSAELPGSLPPLRAGSAGAGGVRSNTSTPCRTPRGHAPASPYGTR
eukprot:TRINITY_DN4711_c0_g9_i1.p1 TRINITY_DN4711_c0_g9~~TRINITY_DN4711_c0_g9_i1.p1  ORF type:complete len:538 (+),score=157.92 TRINITY_DN4711_c0_g9_i1:204-1817(+)